MTLSGESDMQRVRVYLWVDVDVERGVDSDNVGRRLVVDGAQFFEVGPRDKSYRAVPRRIQYIGAAAVMEDEAELLTREEMRRRSDVATR